MTSVDPMGIIITRHVKSTETNFYWNHNIKCIKRLYPKLKIIVIDDFSDKNFLKPFHQHDNITIIQSEFKGRGELLPYIYLIKNNFFKNALIIHDSVFMHVKINFPKLIHDKVKVLPIWHFNPDKEDIDNRMMISTYLQNTNQIHSKLNLNENILGLNHLKWYGCFGAQSFINRDFLLNINQKYMITNLIPHIKTRQDRQCFERILGCIFYSEYKSVHKSLLGDIMTYQKYGYSFQEYMSDVNKKRLPKLIVKVWTGR